MPEYPLRGDSLHTPISHQRNESAASNSYSVLDFYDFASTNESNSLCESQEFVNSSQDSLPLEDNLTLQQNATSSRESKVPANSAGPWTSPEIPSVDENIIEQVLLGETDMYGFKKMSTMFNSTKFTYNTWFKKYSPQYAIQRKKWDFQMKSNGLTNQLSRRVPDRYPPKSEKIKKLIRKGIPPEWRGSAWFFYAGGNERLNKNAGIYHKIVTDTEGVHNKDTEVIERDLYRTFPDNIHFKTESSATSRNSGSTSEPLIISSLRRVLTAFAYYQPQIGYCQSLNFIAGLLLLFMSEEHTFWMLVIMTERIIPKVHSANLEGVHTDQGVLMMCIKEYIPKLWTTIGRAYDGSVLREDKILTRLPPLTLVTSSWFMSVFIGVLPIESVLRIWDIIWYEGSKTIFRISLTLCRSCLDDPTFQSTKHVKAEANAEAEQIELFQFMQNYPKQISDPNLLIDLCFKKIGGYGYGFLSQAEINKCREFVAYERNKIQTKKSGIPGAEMSEAERDILAKSGHVFEDDIHDVYGFNRSIMSGVAWNKHISGIMRKKFAKKNKTTNQ